MGVNAGFVELLPEDGSVDRGESCCNVKEHYAVLRVGGIWRLLDGLLYGGVEGEGLVCCCAVGFETTLTKVQFSYLLLKS